MNQKFLKKGMAFLVSAIMISGITTTVFADSVTSDVSTDSEITESELINIGNQYISVNDSGNIELNLPKTMLKEIGQENFQAMQDGISSINDSINDVCLKQLKMVQSMSRQMMN